MGSFRRLLLLRRTTPLVMHLFMLICLSLGNDNRVWAADDGGSEMMQSTSSERDTAGSDDHVEGHIEDDRAVMFPWFANIIGIVAFYMLARYLHVFPYTACMFCLGTFMGVGYARLEGTSQLHESFELWNNIDGEVLLLVFLPGLLFKDSFRSDVHLVALAFIQCLVMAL